METFSLHTGLLISLSLISTILFVVCVKNGLYRIVATLGFVVMVGLIFIANSSLLGRAKPTQLELVSSLLEESIIQSGYLKEGIGIYLTLLAPSIDEPRLYVMPWNEKTARELMSAMHEADQNGTQTMMRRPYEANLDEQEPLFYAQPQPKLPDKKVPQNALVRLE